MRRTIIETTSAVMAGLLAAAIAIALSAMIPSDAIAGMNGPVCRSNPCTLNASGGWHEKWFAKVDAYAAKGIRFKTQPSKAANFYPQFNDWMKGRRESWPAGYCASACTMTVGRLLQRGLIKIDPTTWFCYCHTDIDHQWGIYGTLDQYPDKWSTLMLTGKPFRLKDAQ
jgi:hypothetical protein